MSLFAQQQISFDVARPIKRVAPKNRCSPVLSQRLIAICSSAWNAAGRSIPTETSKILINFFNNAPPDSDACFTEFNIDADGNIVFADPGYEEWASRLLTSMWWGNRDFGETRLIADSFALASSLYLAPGEQNPGQFDGTIGVIIETMIGRILDKYIQVPSDLARQFKLMADQNAASVSADEKPDEECPF